MQGTYGYMQDDFDHPERYVLHYEITEEEKRANARMGRIAVGKFITFGGLYIGTRIIIALIILWMKIVTWFFKLLPVYAIASFILITFTMFSAWVPCTGDSMRPSYGTEIVNVDRTFTAEDITRGTVVTTKTLIVNYKPQRLMKRVVAVPGDTVGIKDGFLYINGELTTDQFPWMCTYGKADQYAEITLGKDEYFLLGDNRSSSIDSRSFGPVKFERLESIVLTPATEINAGNKFGMSSQEALEKFYGEHVAAGDGDEYLTAIAKYALSATQG